MICLGCVVVVLLVGARMLGRLVTLLRQRDGVLSASRWRASRRLLGATGSWQLSLALLLAVEAYYVNASVVLIVGLYLLAVGHLGQRPGMLH